MEAERGSDAAGHVDAGRAAAPDSVELDPHPTDFDAFFERHHVDMTRALALALGDDELGRDAAAEGFTRALQRWRKVGRYDNPAGWVYRAGLNWARSRRRKTRREIGGWDPELGADGSDEPLGAAVEPDLALRAALRDLSHDHRDVVIARYVLDWSEADIAAALHVPPGTVKSRLHRALDHLATLVPRS